MSEFLTQKALKNLKEHKYACEGKTILQPFFEPHWNWLTEQLPLWIAPNTLTLIGLIVNLIGTLILLYYCPDGKTEPPSWTLFFAAATHYFYQTLDALDGKQARRTGSSSPLGELFDHGCDAVTMCLNVIGGSIALGCGHDLDQFYVISHLTILMYYVAHWQVYASGVMKFYEVDVVEASVVFILTLSFAGVYGIGYYQTLFFGLPLRSWLLYTMVIALLVYFARSAQKIFFEPGAGKNGTTVANSSVLSPAGPALFIFILSYLAVTYSPEKIFEQQPMVFILLYGIVSAKVCNKLIVAHMTKTSIVQVDSVMLGQLAFLVNYYFNTPVDERIVLWCVLSFVTFDLVKYCYSVTRQICDYLCIRCFHIGPPTSPAVNVDGEERPVPRARTRAR